MVDEEQGEDVSKRERKRRWDLMERGAGKKRRILRGREIGRKREEELQTRYRRGDTA